MLTNGHISFGGRGRSRDEIPTRQERKKTTTTLNSLHCGLLPQDKMVDCYLTNHTIIVNQLEHSWRVWHISSRVHETSLQSERRARY